VGFNVTWFFYLYSLMLTMGVAHLHILIYKNLLVNTML
jgi:hypothetical protein